MLPTPNTYRGHVCQTCIIEATIVVCKEKQSHECTVQQQICGNKISRSFHRTHVVRLPPEPAPIRYTSLPRCRARQAWCRLRELPLYDVADTGAVLCRLRRCELDPQAWMVSLACEESVPVSRGVDQVRCSTLFRSGAEPFLERFLIACLICGAESRIVSGLYHHRSEYCRGIFLSTMASGSAEHVPAAGVFVEASESNSEWYEHLKPRGSCLRLYSLLVKKRELIHELGPKGITVLHKGVQHGCVRLVKFVLVNMFDGEGCCTCREHGPGDLRLTREQLLRKGWEDDITAVQMAVVSGSPKMVLLLKWAVDKSEMELKLQNPSSKHGQEIPPDATNVLIRRVQHKSKGNVLFFGKEWDMEGEDMRRLLEDYDPSAPIELGHPDAEEELEEEIMEEVTEETLRWSVIDTEGNGLVVPDVKDDTIDCVYRSGSEESVMIPKVYDLIECILEDSDCFNRHTQKRIQKLKDECSKDVDYEFVPVAHAFLHFCLNTQLWYVFNVCDDQYLPIMERIICACNEHDRKEQGTLEGSRSMVATVFKILDPRGRTILHAAYDNHPMMVFSIFKIMERLDLNEMSMELVKECINSKDGAGRTILHVMCTGYLELATYNLLSMSTFMNWSAKKLDHDAKLSSPCHEELDTLKMWCFPQYQRKCSYDPIHLAILFGSIHLVNHIFSYSNYEDKCFKTLESLDFSEERTMGATDVAYNNQFWPLQQAAFLGRPSIIEAILTQANLKPIKDMGIYDDILQKYSYPAIHCAILSCHVEALQSILKFQIYDPAIQHRFHGTALHFLLKRMNINPYVKMFQTVALFHMLPNSKLYAQLKDKFDKLHFDVDEPKMFSANETSCINLLLQAGIDIWTPSLSTGERPSLGPMANDKAREWWYNKVVSEVVTQKTSISIASNATSVIATLVATASFIGPLQPPLGLADDGFLHTSASAVRVYFVCNGLSFYFSIASILMAVLPAIPMLKESLYDELFRSQRSLKSSGMLLLVAIICILASFTSASIAVVSSERHHIQLVGSYVVVGGAVCVVVLVVYVIRMLRMVFHKNDRFRRWFAQNMRF